MYLSFLPTHQALDVFIDTSVRVSVTDLCGKEAHQR